MDWLPTFIFSALGAIGLNILSTLLSDRIKNWLTRRNLVNKNKKASELEKDIQLITRYMEYPEERNLSLFTRSLTGITILALSINLGLLGILVAIILALLLSNFPSEPIIYPQITAVTALILEVMSFISLTQGLKVIDRTLSIAHKTMFFDDFKIETQKVLDELSTRKD